MKLFSIPFILVGVLVALGVVYTFLTLFNPKPILVLASGEPRLGESFKLNWTIKGRVSRIRQFRIVLKGVESASYTRGTNTVTDTNTFYAAPIADRPQSLAMREGNAEVPIPPDLMYSFEAQNNSITWKIEVRGEIPFWPDVRDEFDINVHPPAPA